MVRSDFIMEIRGYMINPREKRLRALWRVVLWFFVAAFGAIVFAGTLSQLVNPASFGPGLRATYVAVRQIAVYAGLTAIAVGVGYLLDRRHLSDYGLGFDRQWWRDAAFGLGLGIGLPTLFLLGQLATGLLTVTGLLVTGPSDTFAFGPLGAVERLALLGLFFIVQASAEEIVVRGYLLTNAAEGLAGTLGKWRAVVVTTVATGVLFGVLHAANPSSSLLSVANITLYGVLLGGCYVLTGRLGIACGFHVAWNFTLGLYGFPVSGLRTGAALVGTRATGSAVLTGGSFGPEGGLIALVGLLLGTLALAWWVGREYGDVAVREAIAIPTLRYAIRENHER
ncbi:CPBP family intramembrane glutamic endopeptidase [Haloarcula halophila]|uniref:CPBP family intramembrane glutamic endopeptidase n=1 Tax=Haloarcula TaxID=2237 RepID=UPI0023E436F6|nr:type II CAAX endopeptidase family protein [Halomicroarcula sp. DFY41]